MIKAVLFDLDNTLIDFVGMKDRAVNAAVNAMVEAGLGLSKKKARKALFKLYDKYGIEYQFIFQKFLLETTKKIDFKILAKAIVAYRKGKAEAIKTYPKTYETLSELRKLKIKLGIVSDAPKISAWLRLAEMDLIEFFDFVIAFEDTGKRKPERKPFLKALKKLELPAGQVLFVGDNPKKDIKGAKAVGMKTCLAKYGQWQKGKQKADITIDSISELVKVAREMK